MIDSWPQEAPGCHPDASSRFRLSAQKAGIGTAKEAPGGQGSPKGRARPPFALRKDEQDAIARHSRQRENPSPPCAKIAASLMGGSRLSGRHPCQLFISWCAQLSWRCRSLGSRFHWPPWPPRLYERSAPVQWPQMQPDSLQKVRLENTTNPWQSPPVICILL